MKIGELAHRAGLNASAIRYYEKLGLLAPPHRSGGQRRYPPDALDRVLLIRFAGEMGFSLPEISSSSTASATRPPSGRAGKNSPPKSSPKSKPASPAGSVSKPFCRISSIATALPSSNASPPSVSAKTSVSSPAARANPRRFAQIDCRPKSSYKLAESTRV